MGFDEYLYGIGRKALKRWFAPKVQAEVLARRVEFEPIRDRLRVFGSLVVGRELLVQCGEGQGLLRGDTWFAPAVIDVGPDPEINRRLHRYRLLHALAAQQAGFVHRENDPLLRRISALCAVPAVVEYSDRQWPALAEERRELADAVLLLRPDLAALPPASAAIEAWQRVLLGAELAPVFAALAPAVAVWVREAVALRPDSLLLALECARELSRKLPLARRREVLPGLTLWPELPEPAQTEDLVAGAPAPVPTSDSQDPVGGSERQGKARERVERIELSENPADDNPLVHVFEKMKTAEEYQAGQKQVDGSDEMAEHGEALDELELRHVVRSAERSGSLYRAEVGLDGAGSGMGDELGRTAGAVLYDEWDAGKRRYLRDHCAVFDEPATMPESLDNARERAASLRASYHRPIRELRARFEQLQLDREWRTRQLDGTEIDLDAIVDNHGERRARRSPGERVYMSRRRHRRDLAVLVLMDISMSTDSWVADRRVIDVARESVFVFGEAVEELDIDWSVGAFYSNTRRDCHYLRVKDFDKPWKQSLPRLLSLRPQGYTRIGPAIRHATHLLSQSDARRRLLLLLSDGKPTDHDRYEGRHGLADVRKALAEAGRAGMHCHALAVEKEAKRYLPRMFGEHGFQILARPEFLPERLASVCERELA